MKIGIIVLNWNQRDYTVECLKSVNALKKDLHTIKVYLIDNASEECDPNVFEELFPEVKLIANENNLGFTGGNNIGISLAIKEDCDALLLLNNDTTVCSDLLNKLVQTLISEKNIGIVVPKILLLKQKNVIQYAGGKTNLYFGSYTHIGYGEHDDGQYNHVKVTEFCTGTAMLLKTDMIKEIGLLNDDFFLYAEDAEYSCRAKAFGYKLYYNGCAYIYHDESPSLGGYLNPKSFYMSKRNSFYLVAIHGTFLQKIVFFTYSLTYFMLGVFMYSLVKQKNLSLFFTYIKSFIAFLKKEKGKPNYFDKKL